jgi:hypothetical protein
MLAGGVADAERAAPDNDPIARKIPETSKTINRAVESFRGFDLPT